MIEDSGTDGQQLLTEPAPSRRIPAGYHFLTPIWGKSYTHLFLDTVIPAQLSAGNLPVFRDIPGVRYVVYTTSADAETMRAHAAFQALCDIVPVVIELIDEDIKIVHDTMSNCYRRGIAAADAADAAVIFLTPDIVFADGSFATLKRLSRSGHDAIFIPGVRTLKPSMSLALQERYRQGTAISVPPRDLVRLMIDNLHPLTHSSWWEEGDGDLIPAVLFWRAGNEGIVGRCFHLHPVLVYPQRKGAVFFGTVDDDFFTAACPDASADYVVTDSDELFAAELSDGDRMFLTGFRKGSVTDVAEWAEQSTSWRHRKLFEHVILLHAGDKDTDAMKGAVRRATAAAASIDSLMRRTLLQLLFTADRAGLRRLIRFGNDRDLARANGLPFRLAGGAKTTMTDIAIDRLTALYGLYCRGAPRGVAFYQKIKLIGFGPIHRPTIFRFQALYLWHLRRDLLAMLGSPRQAVIVCEAPLQSMPAQLLLASGHGAENALFAVSGGTIGLVSSISRERIGSGSQEMVIVDRCLPGPSLARAAMQEIARILRPDGRLLLIEMARTDPAAGRRSDPRDPDEIGALLAPGLTQQEQRLQGGMGSALGRFLTYAGKKKMRRFRLPLVLLLPLALLVLPLRIAAGLVVTPIFGLLNLAVHDRRYTISSVTLAVKRPS